MKLNQYYNKDVEQETIASKAEGKINRLNKISQESKKQIIGAVESTTKETKRKNAKQINQYNPESNLRINPQKVKNTKKGFYCW